MMLTLATLSGAQVAPASPLRFVASGGFRDLVEAGLTPAAHQRLTL